METQSIATATENSINAIALGGFDGMHMGHQALFGKLGDNGAIIAIESGYANLTPGKYREAFTHYPIYYIALETIRHLDGKAFLNYLQQSFPALKKIVVGYDFRFGKDRLHNHNDLQELFDGEVVVVDEVCFGGDSVHARKIRQMIKEGEIEKANNYLGHDYIVCGEYVRGQGIGKKHFVPTINLTVKQHALPTEGVYITMTKLDGEEQLYPSISFIGHRISTDGSYAVETHILDHEVSCKRMACITFIALLRKNKKFDTFELLKKQIDKDIQEAQKRFTNCIKM